MIVAGAPEGGNHFEKESDMATEEFQALVASVGRGKRVGGGVRGSGSSPGEILDRHIAIATKVGSASIEGVTITQKKDLLTLPECAGLKSDRGIGDFLGLGRGGLGLDLKREGKDWVIEPGPKQAFRAWDYLRTKAPDAASIARRLGFEDAYSLEQEIVRRLRLEYAIEADDREKEIDERLANLSPVDDSVQPPTNGFDGSEK